MRAVAPVTERVEYGGDSGQVLVGRCFSDDQGQIPADRVDPGAQYVCFTAFDIDLQDAEGQFGERTGVDGFVKGHTRQVGAGAGARDDTVHPCVLFVDALDTAFAPGGVQSGTEEDDRNGGDGRDVLAQEQVAVGRFDSEEPLRLAVGEEEGAVVADVGPGIDVQPAAAGAGDALKEGFFVVPMAFGDDVRDVVVRPAFEPDHLAAVDRREFDSAALLLWAAQSGRTGTSREIAFHGWRAEGVRM